MGAAVGAGLGGIVVGYVLCMLLQKGKIATLEASAADLAERLGLAETKSAKLTEQLSGTSESLRSKAEEVGKVQSQLEVAERQRKFTEDKIQKVQVSLDAASKAQQASASQAADAKKKMEALEDQVRHGAKEVDALKQLLERRAKEGSRKDDMKDAFVSAGQSLEAVLKLLVDRESQSVAVLADGTGLVVAGAGDRAMRDGVAATSNLIANATKQLEGVVPFGALRAFLLQDRDKNVIAGKTFDFAGEVMGLATFGPKLPSVQALEIAAEELARILA